MTRSKDTCTRTCIDTEQNIGKIEGNVRRSHAKKFIRSVFSYILQWMRRRSFRVCRSLSTQIYGQDACLKLHVKSLSTSETHPHE